jgi:hypothetical protein
MYSSKHIMLANELAERLNDLHSITQYLKFTQLYSEKQLRETYDRVMAIPQHKITNSRGALFTHLLKQYDTNTQYSRHQPWHSDYRYGDDRQW